MSWTADGYTAIGKSHLLCEDYVLADTDYPAIIVSDGCSSSQHTDLGARFLVHSASRALALLPPEIDTEIFGSETISKAHHSLKALDPSLTTQALDATLLAATQHEDRLRVYVYGDGLIAALHRNGRLEVFRFSAAGNAPYYLTYWLEQERAQRYKEEFGEDTLRQETITSKQTCSRTVSQTGTLLEFDAEQYNCLLLSTDGVETFVNPQTGIKFHFREILQKITQFKLRKGAFLQRRVRRELKCMAKQGFIHSDDIGVAALLKN